MKKISVFFLLGLFLTGCAGGHQVFKNGNHMPVQKQYNLVGQSMDDIQKAFGAPFVIRKEEPNQLWTYRKEGCITMLYFDEDEEVCHAERRGNCPVALAQ